MKRFSLPGMAEATRLTRLGRLSDATALIRSTLSGDRASADAPRSDAPRPDMIEGVFERLEPAARPMPGDRTPPNPQPNPAPRTRLGETLRRIRAGAMPGSARPAAPAPQVPEGASFDRLTHVGLDGQRDYDLYIPRAARSVAPGSMPLVVMLHGCTQTPADFATGTRMNALAEEFGCLVAYPAQPTAANANRCWNWFRPEDQAHGRGEPALIAGIVRQVIAAHPVDPAQVFVAGLSAGGAAAAILGARYPDLFAAVGVHSGLPVGATRDVPSAFAAMRQGARGDRRSDAPPTIVIHGDADATVHPDNGAAVLAQAIGTRQGLRTETETGQVPGGRGYRRTRHRDATGRVLHEHWQIAGAGHAWAGGDAAGSHTDPAGPDASRVMMDFFRQLSVPAKR